MSESEEKEILIKKENLDDENDKVEFGMVYEGKEISITVEKIEKIDICKVKSVTVKMEYNGMVLGQSKNLPTKTCSLEIGFTQTLKIPPNSRKSLDDVLTNPIVFTVYDNTIPAVPAAASMQTAAQSPRVNTKKESKRKLPQTSQSLIKVNLPPSNIIGVCNLNLGSLITEKKKTKETLILESEKKLIGRDIVNWNKLPRLVVVASAEDTKLIPDKLTKWINIVGVTVESVYNIPDTMTEGSIYGAKIIVPNSDDKNNTIVFPNGVVTWVRDSDCRKKWLNLSNVEGRGVRTKYNILPSACNIVHNFSPKVNLKKIMEGPEKRIEWLTWKNTLLEKGDENYFFAKLMKYRVWPIEIFLIQKANEPKPNKSEKKAKTSIASTGITTPDRFIAYLNLSSLLYPGITTVRVAAQLYTYSQADLVSKFGMDISQIPAQSSIVIVKSKSEKSRTSEKEVLIEERNAPGIPLFNQNGDPVFIVVEIEFWKPFTPKRDGEYLLGLLKPNFALKGKMEKKKVNLLLAEENFVSAIKTLVAVITGEYQNFLINNKRNLNSDSEDVDNAFYRFICQQETFQKIQQHLENKVITLIDEKYGSINSYNEMMPQLYIYLVELIHNITNTFVMGQNQVVTTHFNTMDLQLYAEEAFEEEEFSMAKEYLLTKISRHKTNPDFWLDYAIFCVRLKDFETAVEAVREALYLDQNNQMGLLLYGLIMAVFENGKIAELALQVLVAKYPDFIEGWIVLHVFYLKMEEIESADVAYKIGAKLEYHRRLQEEPEERNEMWEDQNHAKKSLVSELSLLLGDKRFGINFFNVEKYWTNPLSWSCTLCPPSSINIRTTILLLKLGFMEFASIALAQEVISETNSSAHYLYYLAVSHYLEGRYGNAITHLETCVKQFGKEWFLWSLMGHCHYKLKDHENAISCYEYVTESFNRPNDIHLIYLRMGYYYLNLQKYSCAKQLFHTGCKYSPTPRMWIGAGICSLRLKEYEEAEMSFSEANYLDNKNPETWGYLALTNAMLQKTDLFNHCYAEAMKRNLKNESLLEEIQACRV